MAKRGSFNFQTVVGIDTSQFKQGVKELQGSIKGLWTSFQSFSVALGAGLGLGALVSRIKDTAVELSTADAVLKNVSRTTLEYVENQQYLAKVSKDYKQNLLDLTIGWGQFEAAANACNVTLEDQRKVYEALTRAAAYYHMSGEQTKYMMLAVTQMFSKGKVQAEELRRQLGNALPGAFGLMAQAIGVTTAQMESMMKAGQVLAGEALPKFADVLNDITQNIDLNSLQLAMNDLANAWNNLIKSGDFESALSKIISSTTSFLNFLGSHIKGITQSISVLVGVWLGNKLGGLLKSIRASILGIVAQSKQVTAETVRQMLIENKRFTQKEIELIEQRKIAKEIDKIVAREAIRLGLSKSEVAALQYQVRQQQKMVGLTGVLKALSGQWLNILLGAVSVIGTIVGSKKLFQVDTIPMDELRNFADELAKKEDEVSVKLDEQRRIIKDITSTEEERRKAIEVIENTLKGTTNEVSKQVSQYDELAAKARELNRFSEEERALRGQMNGIANSIVSAAEREVRLRNSILQKEIAISKQKDYQNRLESAEADLAVKKANYDKVANQYKTLTESNAYKKAYDSTDGGTKINPNSLKDSYSKGVLNSAKKLEADMKKAEGPLNTARQTVVGLNQVLNELTNTISGLDDTITDITTPDSVKTQSKIDGIMQNLSDSIEKINKKNASKGYSNPKDYRKDMRTAYGNALDELEGITGHNNIYETKEYQQLLKDMANYKEKTRGTTKKTDAEKATDKISDIIEDLSNDLENLKDKFDDGDISLKKYNATVRALREKTAERIKDVNGWKAVLDDLEKGTTTVQNGAFAGDNVGTKAKELAGVKATNELEKAMETYKDALKLVEDEAKLYGWNTEELNDELKKLNESTLSSIVSLEEFQFALTNASEDTRRAFKLLVEKVKYAKLVDEAKQAKSIRDDRPKVKTDKWDDAMSYKKTAAEYLKDTYTRTENYIEELEKWIATIEKADKGVRDKLDGELALAQKEVADLRNKIPNMFKKAVLATIEEDIKELRENVWKTSYEGIKDTANSADRLVNAVRNYNEVVDDVDSTAWDEFIGIFNIITQTIDSMLSFINLMKEIGELTEKLSDASAQITKNVLLGEELEIRKKITEEMKKQGMKAAQDNLDQTLKGKFLKTKPADLTGNDNSTRQNTIDTMANTAAIEANTSAKNANAIASNAEALGKDAVAASNTAAALSEGADTTATAANTKGALGNGIANGIKAVVKSFAANPLMGILTTAAIIGSIASVVGMIKNAGNFASGGIIGGTSHTGDKLTANVNSGEMILNRAQQATLFNAINSGKLGGSGNKDVHFTIHGSDLVGVMSNYNRRIKG